MCKDSGFQFLNVGPMAASAMAIPSVKSVLLALPVPDGIRTTTKKSVPAKPTMKSAHAKRKHVEEGHKQTGDKTSKTRKKRYKALSEICNADGAGGRPRIQGNLSFNGSNPDDDGKAALAPPIPIHDRNYSYVIFDENLFPDKIFDSIIPDFDQDNPEATLLGSLISASVNDFDYPKIVSDDLNFDDDSWINIH